MDEVDHKGSRVSTLDGVRGFLALAVLFHHGGFIRNYLWSGHWKSTSAFSYMLGKSAVAMFFMITAYLFWARLIAIGSQMSWTSFYIGRVFRIAPVYLISSCGAIAASLLISEDLTRGFWDISGQILQWMPLGLTGQPDVNGQRTWVFIFGVPWSLRYEWAFYFALPFIAIAATHRRLHLPFAMATFVLPLSYLFFANGDQPHDDIAYIAMFGAGMLTASMQARGLSLDGRQPVFDVCLGAILLISMVMLTEAIRPPAILVLAVAFYLIACGGSLFGLLSSRPAQRLGHISYGIYLLQGLVVWAFVAPDPIGRVFVSSSVAYVVIMLLASLALVAVSAFVYVSVERPYIALGKRLARRIALSGVSSLQTNQGSVATRR